MDDVIVRRLEWCEHYSQFRLVKLPVFNWLTWLLFGIMLAKIRWNRPYAHKMVHGVRCFKANGIALLLHYDDHIFVAQLILSAHQQKSTKKCFFFIYNYCIPFYVRCVFICVHMRSLPNEESFHHVCTRLKKWLLKERTVARINVLSLFFTVCRAYVRVRARDQAQIRYNFVMDGFSFCALSIDFSL